MNEKPRSSEPRPKVRTIDPLAFIDADFICDDYFRGASNVTKEMAQEAAIHAVRESRELGIRTGRRSGYESDFVKGRLMTLGVDPITLEVLPEQK